MAGAIFAQPFFTYLDFLFKIGSRKKKPDIHFMNDIRWSGASYITVVEVIPRPNLYTTPFLEQKTKIITKFF